MPTKEMTGSDISTYLQRQAQRRQELLAEAEQISRDVFAPLGLDPSKLNIGSTRKVKASGGKRAPKGVQAETIQKLLADNGGTITTKMAIEAFEKAGYRTAANAMLMRLKKQGIIANPERGIWTPAKGKKSKAKA